MQCVILAGGLGTRMRGRAGALPKALIPVLGRPFIAYQLEWLARQGVRRIVLSIGYRGDMIAAAVGDGSAFGVSVAYSNEDDALRGTGGAVRLAADLGLLEAGFFVLYGDSYLPLQYRPVADSFHRSGKLGLMTVYHNQGKYDTSNVVYRDGQIVVYDKKAKLPEMHHIDYGLSLFKASVFDAYPASQVFDLAEVMGNLVKQHQLAGYEVPERFYEMGSPSGLKELEELLGKDRI